MYTSNKGYVVEKHIYNNNNNSNNNKREKRVVKRKKGEYRKIKQQG